MAGFPSSSPAAHGPIPEDFGQPTGGGAPKLLADFTPEQIFSFAISRDGKSLAFARGTLLRDVVLISESEQ